MAEQVDSLAFGMPRDFTLSRGEWRRDPEMISVRQRHDVEQRPSEHVKTAMMQAQILDDTERLKSGLPGGGNCI